MKLVVEEAESAVLTEHLADGRRLVASWLLHTELHCAAGRHPDDVDAESVRTVLDTVDLADLTRGDMIAAGTYAPLRSNDAIRLGVDEMVTYDVELAGAATATGIAVFAPDP